MMGDDSFYCFTLLFFTAGAPPIAPFGIDVFAWASLEASGSRATTGTVTIGYLGAYNYAFLSVISVYMQAVEIESSPPSEKQSIFWLSLRKSGISLSLFTALMKSGELNWDVSY